jgi:hypothetical protein
MHRKFTHAQNNFLSTDFGTLKLNGDLAKVAQWIVIGVTLYKCIDWSVNALKKN